MQKTWGSIPGLGKSPEEGNGNPLQYSCLEKSHGQQSLVGYSPWGRKELDTTERLHIHSTLNIQKTKIMASGPIISWQIDGETMETVRDFILGAQKSLQIVTAAMKLKEACSLEEKL